MVVAVLEIALAVPAISLKEKRSVVRRVIHRTRDKFGVAMAEVDELDTPGAAVLGVAAVGNDRRLLESTLKKIENFIDQLELAEITDSSFVLENY